MSHAFPSLQLDILIYLFLFTKIEKLKWYSDKIIKKCVESYAVDAACKGLVVELVEVKGQKEWFA
jgi:hypothetical protein